MSSALSPARFGLTWRGAWLRGVAPLLVLCAGYIALAYGAGASERTIPDHPLPRVYYLLGLFVLGGLDLGTPIGQPDWARHLLWGAYFAAPLLTATALLEVLWALALPMAYRLRRLRDHTVIVGASRLTELYLERLRTYSPRAMIVMVDRNPDNPRLQSLLAKYPMTLVVGDINSTVTLGLLQLERARRVVLLTGNDFTNLNAASFIVDHAPSLAGRVVLHVNNLRLLQSVGHARAAREAAVFNSHEIAARHLIERYLRERFASTTQLDCVVLAGFGRFGQSVLQSLQELAGDGFAELVVVDFRAEDKLSAFADRVGLSGKYSHYVSSGNLLECSVWNQLDQRCALKSKAPLIIVGADDDMVNLEAALWLRSRYPDAYIVARHFQRSSFSAQIARDYRVLLFSIADLIAEAIPKAWCVAPDGSRTPTAADGRSSHQGI